MTRVAPLASASTSEFFLRRACGATEESGAARCHGGRSVSGLPLFRVAAHIATHTRQKPPQNPAQTPRRPLRNHPSTASHAPVKVRSRRQNRCCPCAECEPVDTRDHSRSIPFPCCFQAGRILFSSCSYVCTSSHSQRIARRYPSSSSSGHRRCCRSTPSALDQPTPRQAVTRYRRAGSNWFSPAGAHRAVRCFGARPVVTIVATGIASYPRPKTQSGACAERASQITMERPNEQDRLRITGTRWKRRDRVARPGPTGQSFGRDPLPSQTPARWHL